MIEFRSKKGNVHQVRSGRVECPVSSITVDVDACATCPWLKSRTKTTQGIMVTCTRPWAIPPII